ncbi:TPA: hypothetical protein ACSPY6_001728 [Pseudomonas aeruginosa]|uniref:hypothetical protein n=1 Tax=Pseudomonas aeruginosa TaxID=287 RepID=UPI0032E3A216
MNSRALLFSIIGTLLSNVANAGLETDCTRTGRDYLPDLYVTKIATSTIWNKSVGVDNWDLSLNVEISSSPTSPGQWFEFPMPNDTYKPISRTFLAAHALGTKINACVQAGHLYGLELKK